MAIARVFRLEGHARFLAFTSNVSEKGGNRGCLLTNTALKLAAHDPEAAKVVAHS
jgi:hypothetical protein